MRVGTVDLEIPKQGQLLPGPPGAAPGIGESHGQDRHHELCAEIGGPVQAFLNRPTGGSWPHLWIDAAYLKIREAGRIVSVAVAVNAERRPRGAAHGGRLVGRRALLEQVSKLAFAVGTARVVKLIVSEAYEGAEGRREAALRQWQRCRMHFNRNALARVGVNERQVVATAIRTAVTQETEDAATKNGAPLPASARSPR